jgi:inositol polyphosphate 5-phosphatase INPP5B/F
MSLKPEGASTSHSRPPPSPGSPLPSPPGSWPTDLPTTSTVGTSVPQSLSAVVRARKDEYTRKRSIRIKVGTWNVASISGTEKDLGAWFVRGLGVKGLSQDLAGLSTESSSNLPAVPKIESVDDQEGRKTTKKESTLPTNDIPAVPHDADIGLYVLGLQEVIDVASVTEAVKPYTDPNPGKKWKSALRQALPPGYEKVAEQQLLGLLILIFASSSIASTISSVSCTSVGTGLMGYLGNKGAVSVRLVLAETTRLCFVNCHLAAGADQTALARRIWDTGQIISRTRFSPVSIDGEEDGPEEKIGNEDFAFWFGDLNYRLDDIPGEDVRRLLLLHTRNEYDIINKSKRKIDTELGYVDAGSEESAETYPADPDPPERPATASAVDPELDPKSDPASLVTTLHSLLSHDQLRAQQRLRKAFHEGWREGEINFLPTYKYDVGSVGMFDSGEKKRSPSWCDRILFRTRADRLRYEEKVKHEAEARKKDEEMKKKGLDQDAADQDVLFDYDPDTDGLAYGDDYDEDEDAFHDAELIETHEGFEDEIELDHYISHQRVLSSDHKPLDAIFTLTYDAVVPELKARIHQEVAREFDKAENEGRPAITVVVDPHETKSSTDADDLVEQEDSNCVNFGQIRYRIPKHRSITVANTGQVAATFKFVGKEAGQEQNSPISPPWLQVSLLAMDRHDEDPASKSATQPSMEITLSPGETKTIQLTIDVADAEFVTQLNQYATQVEDVLILRVKDGRDHFVPVKGKWMPTCFCRTLDELVVAPEGGVRSIPRRPKNRDGTGTKNLKSSPTHHSAPKEFFALTEAITALVERSVAEWDILHPNETPPWKHEADDTTWPFDPSTWTFHAGEERTSMLETVREALDTARPINEHTNPDEPCMIRLEVLAESLTSFLESLRDGIIPTTMWTEIEQSFSTAEREKNLGSSEDIQAMVMEHLSSAPVHSVSMTFLTFMLSRILKEIAPASKEQLKTPTLAGALSRRSRASSILSETESERSTSPSVESSGKRSFLDTIRRRRGQSISASTNAPDAETTSVLDRRKALLKNYTALFAPLIIRSANDRLAKGKEKRILESRKRKVLEAFLETALL